MRQTTAEAVGVSMRGKNVISGKGRKFKGVRTCFGDGDGEVGDDDEPPGFDELAPLAAGGWGLDWSRLFSCEE